MTSARSACPWCGGVLELVRHPDGYIVEQYCARGFSIIGQAFPERARLAPFVACTGCEYCEEVAYANRASR